MILAAALTLAGCATVTTQVTVLDPSKPVAIASGTVEILLAEPARPHEKLALLESRGPIGEPEGSLLEDIREKARALGADAVIRTETTPVWHEPVTFVEPWPPLMAWRGRRFASPFFYDPLWGSHLYGRSTFGWPRASTWPGGFSYTVKAVAIRYLPQ
jgi:hypothetical protein